MAKTIEKKQFTLQGRDWLRGLIVAVITPVVVIVQQSLDAGVLTFDWKSMGMAALAGGLSYITMNFLDKPKKITIHD